jgi:ribonuclease-3
LADAALDVPLAPGAEALGALADRLGHRFDDPRLLATALRHRSWCVEHPGYESNERLEFLGDAVLGSVVAAELYRRHPDLAEGRLTDARKSVVSTTALAPAGERLGLGVELLLGRGEDNTGGRQKPSLLENAFEAVVGAVFLDGGYEAAVAVVLDQLGDAIAMAAAGRGDDYKSALQELLARDPGATPRYEISSEGPDHAREFSATVVVDGRALGSGHGRSKKQAEQEAARLALAALDVLATPASPLQESEASHA